MNVILRLLLAALGLPVPTAGPVEPASPTTLTVFAAASLTEAFGILGRRFEQQHPGTVVRFSFGGSQQLALQLEQGARADVFAPADRRWMEYVKDKGLVRGETPVFARNRLVVIVPRTNPARIKRLEDLARRGTKLVVAAEAVPAGRYTREALGKLAQTPGYPQGYDRRVLANVVSQEENVKSVVSKVQLGEADAGVVYRSDVTAAVSRYVTVLDLPDAGNVIAEYPIAVLRGAPGAATARAFVALVIGDEGQRLLQAHNLLPATPRP
jgi:molybdate transport system substrate-binding protein